MPSKLETITRKRRREMQRTESQAAGDILRVYESVITGIRSDLDAVLQLIDEARANGETVNPDWLRRQSRYQRLLSQATRQFERFSGQALTHLDSARYRAVSGGAMMAYETLGALDIATDVSPFSGTINRPALERFVSATRPGPLRDVFDRFGAENADLIQDTIARGIAQGKGAKAIRREIMRGLSGDYPKHRIQTIVRTEMQRAFNASLAEQYKQVEHLISGYRWVAAKSNRTCLACLGQDGRIFKRFPLRQHVNCRCTASPVAPDSEVPYESGEAWLRRQPDHIQRRMFPTPDAWLAFRDGKVGLSDFVGTKSNKTWGNSIYQRSWSSIAKKKGLPYRSAQVSRGRAENRPEDDESTQRLRRNRDTIERARERIRFEPVEYGYIFDAKGRQIARFRGTSSNMRIRDLKPEEIARMVDGVFVHNHPDYSDGTPAGSFSNVDLYFMRAYNLAEIQAVTPRRTYILRRKAEGYYMDEDIVLKTYNRIYARLQHEYPGMHTSELQDRVVQQLADDGFYDYRVEDR